MHVALSQPVMNETVLEMLDYGADAALYEPQYGQIVVIKRDEDDSEEKG